jgi:hypothetical protein
MASRLDVSNGRKGERRRWSSAGAHSEPDRAHPQRTEPTMLWTILIILAIIALALFIFSRVRGRGV